MLNHSIELLKHFDYYDTILYGNIWMLRANLFIKTPNIYHPQKYLLRMEATNTFVEVRLMKKLLAVFVSLVFLFSISSQGYAQTKESEDAYSDFLVQAIQLDEVFSSFIVLDGDYVKFKEREAIKSNISNEMIQDAKEKVEEFNKIIADSIAIKPFISFVGNELQFDAVGAEKNGVSEELINATKEDVEKISKSISSDDKYSIAACSGKNAYVDHWYGYDTYFDSCNTNKIIGLLTVGAGIATIVAAVTAAIAPPVAVAAGIAAGLMGIGAGTLTYANAEGCGVYIKWTLDKPWWTGSQC